MDLTNFEVDKKLVLRGINKVRKNGNISNFYKTYAENINEEIDGTFHRKSSQVKNCYRWWKNNVYRLQNVIDVQSVALCHDKFCSNCQNELSKKRYTKYVPILQEYNESYDIYHIIFTAPTVTANCLKSRLETMYQKFAYIIDYLKGKKKVKGVNFLQYGYGGAVRSLEITCKKKNGVRRFHPHFHCLFLLKKGLNFEKKHVNKFSRSKNNVKSKNSSSIINGLRYFSDFEILLQKIWFILINQISFEDYLINNDKIYGKVTLKAIEEIQLGYDVVCEKIDDEAYKEVFKYTLKEDYRIVANNYEVFETLHKCLKRRRVIQAYGALKDFDFDERLIEKEVEDSYTHVRMELAKTESPLEKYHDWDDIVSICKNNYIKMITRNGIRKYILVPKNEYDSSLDEENKN